MKTALIFIIFNRPETTRMVFECIKKTAPQSLLIIADGPRADHPEEKEKCAECRSIAESVDWDCKVIKNYSDINMGCKRRVSSGLDWAFNIVEEAIILEDDCVPDMSFFPYCEELLEKYRNDTRIGVISGANLINSRNPNLKYNASYFFTKYVHIWGWASWKRTWKTYDVDMKHWISDLKNGILEASFHDPLARLQWKHIFTETYENRIDTWDFQLNYASLREGFINIVPSVNLIKNVGFDGNAGVHCNARDINSYLPAEEIQMPLQHPINFIPQREMNLLEDALFLNVGKKAQIKENIRNIVRSSKNIIDILGDNN